MDVYANMNRSRRFAIVGIIHFVPFPEIISTWHLHGEALDDLTMWKICKKFAEPDFLVQEDQLH